ncbi:TAF5-like RNA polymerase II p300/CBP-associated factor-associated factor 65 kDa subunit 5L [Gigantopelta aegis]|uniref:TAF5-like RNA polymerase II p300/CBP-associated factor-associated factor 65 kDa subunit 5L n=1 Tax=Gigantopelta aegis TaxID=1735272 RepID=UPI001B88E2C5|nr:TAF5-like RNA polymerase II p300/CBP-associated factor-associated factor 65 kDa subunit 5L [Gigantopelta aegis]
MRDVLSSTRQHSYFKMKRVKDEQIQSSVNHYLKRRQFMDLDIHSKNVKMVQNISEMTLRSQTNATNIENMLSYSSISGDATACDQQFTRLKNFISDAVEPYSRHLQSLLYPVFVHVYLEMLCNGHRTPAHKFHDRHIALFKDDDDHRMIIKLLKRLDSKTDVLSCKDVSDFRDHRFPVFLSDGAMAYLMRHLQNKDNQIMLQIFNQHLKVDVRTETSVDVELKSHAKQGEVLTVEEPPKPSTPSPGLSEVSLPVLQQCIKKIREGPPCLASICFYTFINAYQGLCSASISPDNGLLSAAFEDSSIMLWSLLPGHLQTEPSDGDSRRLRLAVDDILQEDASWPESQRQENETVTLRSHNGSVYKTCFTPDSQFMLSCSEDTTVRLWKMNTHTNVVCYRGHSYPVWDVDASLTGGYFASCSQDRTAKMWCTDRIYPLRSFVGHTYDVDCVKFHPNGNYIATGSGDKTVRLWSTQEGKSVRLLQGHRGSVLTVAFSPDGQLLASAGEDRRVRVWDLSSGNMIKELRGHTDTIYALSFSSDSSVLASGGLDSCIWLWDVRRGGASNTASSDGSTSRELLGAYPTKSASVVHLQFSKQNILRATGTIS